MLRPTSFGQGKKSPGTASMMLPGGSKEEEIFIFGLQKKSISQDVHKMFHKMFRAR